MWGDSGELVCLKPIPCQPTHFWNDENGSKYHKAYFSTYPGNPQTINIFLKTKKKKIEWHFFNSVLSAQACGHMGITVKSTQRQEAL